MGIFDRFKKSSIKPIAQQNEIAIEKYFQALRDSDWETRQNAVRILRKLKDPRSIEPLTEMLNDPDSDIRDQAAKALSEITAKQYIANVSAPKGANVSQYANAQDGTSATAPSIDFVENLTDDAGVSLISYVVPCACDNIVTFLKNQAESMCNKCKRIAKVRSSNSGIDVQRIEQLVHPLFDIWYMKDWSSDIKDIYHKQLSEWAKITISNKNVHFLFLRKSSKTYAPVGPFDITSEEGFIRYWRAWEGFQTAEYYFAPEIQLEAAGIIEIADASEIAIVRCIPMLNCRLKPGKFGIIAPSMFVPPFYLLLKKVHDEYLLLDGRMWFDERLPVSS
jgi:hypothetical protein